MRRCCQPLASGKGIEEPIDPQRQRPGVPSLRRFCGGEAGRIAAAGGAGQAVALTPIAPGMLLWFPVAHIALGEIEPALLQQFPQPGQGLFDGIAGMGRVRDEHHPGLITIGVDGDVQAAEFRRM